MFFEPTRTPYDLNWRMLGTHVRVHPLFWLMALLLGWPLAQAGFQYVLIWVLCVFVSILVHEFGHVLMGRFFGSEGHIVLYSFGGLAIGSNGLSSPWKRIAVSFAGPAAGFVLLVIVCLAVHDRVEFSWDRPWPRFRGPPSLSPMAEDGIEFLIWINLAWGLLNLLPIWPLDGGQISRDLLGWFWPRGGVKAAYGISLVVAGLLAIIIAINHEGKVIPWLPLGGMFNALLFGLLAFNSYQALEAERRRSPWDTESRW